MGEAIVYKGESYFKNNASIYVNIAPVRNDRPIVKHSHDFIEIAYVSSGRGCHIIGDEYRPVSKGDIFIINHGIPHAFKSFEDEAQGMVIFNCVFMPDFIDYALMHSNDFKDVTASALFNSFMVDDKPVIGLSLSTYDRMEIEEIYRKMHVEYYAMPKGYVNVLRLYLIELLIKIFRLLDSGSTGKANICSRRAEIANKALEFLKANYASPELNLNGLAAGTFLSRSYLSKLFKEATGQSMSAYLQNLRIAEACRLLKSTDRKVAAIMSDVGFKDIKHFNSLFKKITGYTPSEYRMAHIN